MGDQSSAEKRTASAWPFAPPNVAEAWQVQMRALLQEQAELLDETQRMMTAWTKRRQEAMEAGLRTFQALCASKDAGEMTGAYADWLTNSMNRISADMDDARDEALRLSEIGQKSMTAFFRNSADATGTTSDTGSSAAAEQETRRTRGTLRTEAAHAGRERTAAE